MATASIGPRGPLALDPSKFVVSGNTVHYTPGYGQGNDIAIPLSYFTSGQYQQDLAQYGQAEGPGFIFAPGSTYRPGQSAAPDPNQGIDPALYAQNDQGQVIGWSNAEQSRRNSIDNAYNAMLSGSNSTTSFDTPGQPPQQLGSDVFGGLAQSGLWMPPGSDASGTAQPVQARIDPNTGNIIVTDPRGGNGNEPIYTYSPTGQFISQTMGEKSMSPLMGVASVGLAALGFGALAAGAGGAAGAAGAGTGGGAGGAAAAAGAGSSDAAIAAAGAGAGGLGAGAGAGAGAGITGADMAAGAGLGSGAAGASFGGLGTGAAGGGFGIGTLGDLGIGGASTFGSAGVGGLAGAGAALDAAGAGGAAGAAGAGGAGDTLQGVPPPANPNVGGLGSLGSLGNLGNLATAAGGLLGAQGTQTSTTADKTLPAFLQGPVINDLIPRTQGLLASQMPQAQQAGQQMMTAGTSLLNQPVSGNGVDQVKLNAPTTNTNPYLGGMADDIGRRTQQLLGTSLNGIAGNSVGTGGLGGARQGVAQGSAIKGAADSLQGNLANLYGTQYSNDQNRALTQYGMDQGFYTNQRSQDLTQAGIGAGLLGQGLSTQWLPIQGAAGAYSPFTGFGTSTTTANSGGGLSGAVGGALGAAQLAKNLGLFNSAV